jgi:hypothetical protein
MEELKTVSYLDVEHLQDRTVNLMPLWDGEHWRMWVPTQIGLIEGKMLDTVEGDYVAVTPAKATDLYIPFVNLMWQHASWPEVSRLISAISDDFHNMGTSIAKMRHFFDCQNRLRPGEARRFAATELEYIVILSRTVFDLLQEIISKIWNTRIRLLDEKAEAHRRSHPLPDRFSKLTLYEKRRPKTVDEIQEQYQLPTPLTAIYAQSAPFFFQLRDIRDRIVHGGRSFGTIFDTERGFCVDPKIAPFNSFEGWRSEHYYNENIASILPWIANIILQTIGACNALTDKLASIITLPPKIAPNHLVFVRGPHNESLMEVLRVQSGGAPWWVIGAKAEASNTSQNNG